MKSSFLDANIFICYLTNKQLNQFFSRMCMPVRVPEGTRQCPAVVPQKLPPRSLNEYGVAHRGVVESGAHYPSVSKAHQRRSDSENCIS